MSVDALGHQATGPLQFPARGWKEILWRVWQEVGEDRVMLIAAGVTYYLLLAMVPGMTALVSIYGLFLDRATIQEHLGLLQGLVPGGGMEILQEQMTRLASQEQAALGLAFGVSLVLALWSANAGMKALFEAMNVAYEEREKRGFVKVTLVSLGFTLGAIFAVLCLIVVVVVMPRALALVGLAEGTEWLIAGGSYAALLLVASLGTAALYRWGPSRERARWRWVTPGCVLAIGVILVVSLAFSWYVANFGSYNATYGSLGALIGFLTWLWISVNVLIVGAELNAEMEHQTAHDTTTGPVRPMGARGAYMADHVAGEDDPPPLVPTAKAELEARGTAPVLREETLRRAAGTLAVVLPVIAVVGWLTRPRGGEGA
ncbi:YihY/virulence factor BrkB family protein [Zavarzinia sp. CC-PAN008]|uniref:YihY/virulence factor BrkB family protein n=1 Tax=Zavarzinia sp. CC-PAN008 TaxID=3243332 RepID=UPI003F7441F6